MQILNEIRRYVRVGWQHRWKALLLAWVICIPGWIAIQRLPDQYESSARVYADADAVLSALLRGLAIDASPASQVELLQRTLLSRPNLEKIIARTDLDMRVDSVESREALLASLAKTIRIATQTRNLFTISYSDHDARLTRDVVQAVLNLFIEQATATDRQQMQNAQTFLNQQIASYETQLRDAERRRAEFRARYLDILPMDALGGATRLEQARAKLQQLRGSLVDTQRRRELIRQQLEATPATVSLAELGADNRLAEAERALRELRLRFTEQHPEVVAARKTIEDLRAQGLGRGGGAAGRTAITNPLHEQLKLRLVDVDGEIASIERQIREEQAETERLEQLARGAPQVQAQFTNLDRDYSVLQKNYEELLARRESLQIAGAARTGADRVRLEVVDPPTLPTSPSGPNRLILSAGVLVVGLGAGVVLAFLLAQLDRSFHSLQDLRKIGLPVIGALSPAQPPRRRPFAVLVFLGAFALLLATFGAVVADGPALMARLPEMVARLIA